MKRLLFSWLSGFFREQEREDIVEGWRDPVAVRPGLGICCDCSSVQELSVHGTCVTCGSSSVIRRGAVREMGKRVQRRRVDRVLRERRAMRERSRFGVQREDQSA